MNANSRFRVIAVGTLLFLSLLLLGACSGGSTASGGGIVATGRTSVSGNVVSSDLADGNLSGITVSAKGKQSVTNARGVFKIDEVMSGDLDVVFSKQGQSARFPLKVSSGSQTILKNVRIRGSQATPEQVAVEDTDHESTNDEAEDHNNEDDNDDSSDADDHSDDSNDDVDDSEHSEDDDSSDGSDDESEVDHDEDSSDSSKDEEPEDDDSKDHD